MSTIAVGAETVQVRRLSWAEFYRILPDRKPANDTRSDFGASHGTHGGSQTRPHLDLPDGNKMPMAPAQARKGSRLASSPIEMHG
ncbi:hypothetical protein X744_12845 [Mesorhizobium sp. LNJC372A00]|nr:hypothetical protein X744_12845 [Mesorhizobium sp. LNJC372A00]